MKSKREKLSTKDRDEFAAQEACVKTREDYLVKGHNGLESAVIISDQLGNFWGGPKLMEWETIKWILRTLNQHGINYAIIGGIAMGHHALPRATHDLDILVASKDLPKVRKAFKKCYKGGTTVVQIYDVEGTRLDVLPANLKHRVAALNEAIDSALEEIPTKVVSVRDLLILKLFAAAERAELLKKRRDEADVTELLNYGKKFLSKEDLEYIAKSVLAMGHSKEDIEKYRAVIQWLNETLELLEMGDLRYPLNRI
ncbi:MAG: hypothetical protein ACE5IW_03225 [bacterium]